MAPITIKFSDVNGTFIMTVPREELDNFWLMFLEQFCFDLSNHLDGSQTWTLTKGMEAPPRGGHTESIQVFDFDTAPAGLKKLSRHGGDEDRLAVIPKELRPHINKMFFLNERIFSNFVSKHVLADGRVVFIGAHA